MSGRFPVTTVASELEGREKDGWAVVATQTFREIRIGFVGRRKRSHLGFELVGWSASALVAELPTTQYGTPADRLWLRRNCDRCVTEHLCRQENGSQLWFTVTREKPLPTAKTAIRGQFRRTPEK